MSSSYYFQKEEEEEESREDGDEIRRTVHHVVEEIIVEEEEEYGEEDGDDWSVPSSPAPPRPPPAMPMAMPMPSPASLASSQSAYIGMGSEEGDDGDEANGAKWGQITVNFPILVGTTPEATVTNSPPPTSRPILPSSNNFNGFNFMGNLGNNTMAAQPVQGTMPKGLSPKRGRGHRIAPETAKTAHPSGNLRRKSLTAPQRALLLFCATLLFLLFSTILVLLILFWFNPTL